MVHLMEGMYVMAKAPEPRKAIRAFVEDKLRRNECLHCERTAKRRGCCDLHYRQYRLTLLATPENRRAAFEVDCIREGRIATDRQGQRIGSRNVFSELARN